MQELQTDLLLICSSVSPASLGGIDRAADDFRELGDLAARRGLRVGYRGAGLGTPRQRLPRRLGDRATRRSQIDRRHSRQLPCAGAEASDRRDPVDPGRQDLPGAIGRRAEARTRHAVLEPAFPLLSRPGRSAGARTSWRRSRRPATPARCRWRFSTTSSAPARRRGPRSTGCARSLLLQDQLAASAPRCVAHDALRAESAQPRRRLHRIRRQRDQGRRHSPNCSASSAFARPGSTAARRSSAGRRARIELVINCETRRLCPFALRHPWAGRLRHRARRRQRRPGHGARQGAEDADLLSAGRTGRTGNSRDPRRRRQPAVFPR